MAAPEPEPAPDCCMCFGRALLALPLPSLAFGPFPLAAPDADTGNAVPDQDVL